MKHTVLELKIVRTIVQHKLDCVLLLPGLEEKLDELPPVLREELMSFAAKHRAIINRLHSYLQLTENDVKELK